MTGEKYGDLSLLPTFLRWQQGMLTDSRPIHGHLRSRKHCAPLCARKMVHIYSFSVGSHIAASAAPSRISARSRPTRNTNTDCLPKWENEPRSSSFISRMQPT